MNFNGRLFIWWVLYITNQYLTEGAKECVQRRLGACKVLSAINNDYKISLKDFHSPQQAGFALKTSMEINLLDNKHSFENNLLVERMRPIGYNLDNAAVVTIGIGTNIGSIEIHLGQKYYRLVELNYVDYHTGFSEKKYNRYTPSLPTFPYNLHLEITTNGTFSVYEVPNTEPFFKYQLTQDFSVKYIEFDAPGNQTDIIVFVDCSEKDKPNCGSHRVERLYGCRYVLISSKFIYSFEGFGKTYGKDVLFDEFFIVETEYSSKISFNFQHHHLNIVFKLNSIEAQLRGQEYDILKSVRTEQWFEVPASPYAVRVLLTTGENNNFLKISNLRSEEILSLNLCVNVGSLEYIHFGGPKLYFDCLYYDDLGFDEVYFDVILSVLMSERPRKIDLYESHGFQYHEYGYNYTKTLLDTRDYVRGPFVMYHHEFGDTTQDWCKGPKPEVLVTSKYDNGSVQAVIEKSNAAVLTELEEINAENKARAEANTAVLTSVLTELEKISSASLDANTAVLTELEKISKASVDANKALTDTNKALTDTNQAIADTNQAIVDTNEVLLFELRSVKASIDALATHLKQNATTVNNYNNNQLNVTEL